MEFDVGEADSLGRDLELKLSRAKVLGCLSFVSPFLKKTKA